MNIGVVVDNEFYNDLRVVNQCEIIAKNYTVHVLCFDFGASNNNNNIYKTSKIKINRKYKDILFTLINTIDLYSYFWAREIKKFIRKNDIKILHVHDLYMSKPAYIATKNTKVKIILDLHENYPIAIEGYKWMNKFPIKLITKPYKWKRKEKKLLSYPNKIIVLSKWYKNKLLSKYQFLTDTKFEIYPNIPNIKELLSYNIQTNILKKNKDDFILFYFGGISKRRGIKIVFEALKILIRTHPNIKLLLIGPIDKNEKKTFLEIINSKELKNNIIYYDWKDISLLPSYIAASDVCLSPIEKNDQHESGIANKIFQYMLLGKPLLVSDCKPQKDLVCGEETGFSFKWNSVEDFIRKLKILYNNDDLRNEMGYKGKKAIINNFSFDIYGKNILKAYNDLSSNL